MAFIIRSKMSEEEKRALDAKIDASFEAKNFRQNFSVGDHVTFKDGTVRRIDEDTGDMYGFAGLDRYIAKDEIHKWIR